VTYFIGRYLLVDPIAEGGMGSVWRAWDAQRREYVAAKLLRPADAGSLLRFVREQSLRVSHPHVVAPTGWAAQDDQVLLTMDLVRGGSVTDLLRDYGTVPVPYGAVLVDQLLQALTAVHERGIVHRDVKPSNLLLEPTGRDRPVLRLADFGIAAVLDEPRMTQTDVVLGSPGYLAPEVAWAAEPDVRQDLYGVGVVAVRLLAGAAAVPAGAAATVAAECPAGVAEPLWAVVRALTALSPQDRPVSAAAAREVWLEAVAVSGVPPIDASDPDAVEVFERVGALPPGFGPHGPDAPPSTPSAPAPPLSAGALPPQLSPALPEPPEPAAPPARRGRGRIAAILGGAAAATATALVVAFSAADGSRPDNASGPPSAGPAGPSGSPSSAPLTSPSVAGPVSARPAPAGPAPTTRTPVRTPPSAAARATTAPAPPAPAAKNLLPDPGVEASPPGWVKFGTGILTQVTTHHSGAHALQVTTDATGATSAGATNRPVQAITGAGRRYRASCWVRASGSVNAYVQLQEYTKDWVRAGDAAAGKVALTVPDRWYQVSVSYTAAKSGNQLPLSVYSNGLRAGGVALLVDDCVLVAE
jgi:eukaryotic-like serine/threonine-protein kinase